MIRTDPLQGGFLFHPLFFNDRLQNGKHYKNELFENDHFLHFFKNGRFVFVVVFITKLSFFKKENVNIPTDKIINSNTTIMTLNRTSTTLHREGANASAPMALAL